MVLIEDLTHLLEIFGIFGFLIPGNLEHPVQIAVLDIGFGRSRLQHLIPSQLLCEAVLDVLRIRIVLDHLAHLFDVTGVAGSVAEFFLDRLDLFAQEVFLLAFVDVLLDLLIDRGVDLGHALLLFQLRDDQDHALVDIGGLKDLLLGRHRHREVLGKLIR